MARRTHEQVVKEYAKEYDRIRKQISRMKKRGYDVSGIQPERVAKKDITSKDLEKLKKLTNEKIYQKSEYQGFSGEFMKKAEQHERAKKGWKTRRRKEEKPSVPKEPPAPPVTPPAPPEEPEDGGLTDEEAAALQRFEEITNMFESQIRNDLNNWASRLKAKLGEKKFAGMLADAIRGGLIVEYRPPSQQGEYSRFLMQTINTYLPPEMDENDRKDTEDEWNDLIDAIADDDDFFPFD